MNKAEFVEKLAKKTQMSKSQSEQMLDSALEIIQNAVREGAEVKLVGFGSFDRTVRKARNGRNPKTGSLMSIPASCVPRFRPGKDFKKKVSLFWEKSKA